VTGIANAFMDSLPVVVFTGKYRHTSSETTRSRKQI
jgi:thiamine pyrophosphate-dependent acetolactate synthase large subunit-like protein